MKKGFLGAMAMFALATVGTSSGNDFSRSVESTGITKGAERTGSNENQQPAKKQPISQKDVKRFQRNYLAHNSFSNPGIPPKIYGMYHVKRGTHKRTNI